MKLIYISNKKSISKDEALKWFQAYCDNHNDLHIMYDFISAKEFLVNQVIGKQKHIDFIITDWEILFQNAKEFLSWLREANNEYSNSNFQLRSLPVFLIEDTKNQSSFISEGFDGTISDFPNNLFLLRQTIKIAIKAWRHSIADDLDLIGLDPKTQIKYFNRNNKFISYHKLKVLTRKFVDNKSKRLNYLWNDPNALNLHHSNQIFDDKITSTRKFQPKNLEKEFHKFFLENPTFIRGEDFECLLYEKHLYKNGTRKYDEPDFINKPYIHALRSPEVFEIKRHTQKLLNYSVTSFLSKTKKSFDQVKRYKSYMTSKNILHQNYIKLYIGKVFNSYEYTLLIGSLDEKLEHENLIKKLKKDFDFEDINLLSYEELLHRHIRLCDRLSDFNIF